MLRLIENRAPSVFGLQMYIVMSGSMSPAVEMGSLGSRTDAAENSELDNTFRGVTDATYNYTQGCLTEEETGCITEQEEMQMK